MGLKQKYSTGSKIFLVVASLLSFFSFLGFVFYGHKLHDLVVGVGFVLMIYGTYKNDNRSSPSSDGDKTFDKTASYASAIGVAMVFIAFIVQYLV